MLGLLYGMDETIGIMPVLQTNYNGFVLLAQNSPCGYILLFPQPATAGQRQYKVV